VFEQTTAKDILARTKPTISLYCRPNFVASSDATRFSKAFASLHAIPSTEYAKGEKVRLLSRQASKYLSFFFLAALSSTFFEEELAYDFASVSVTQISNMQVSPFFQRPCTATSPHDSSPKPAGSSSFS